MKPNELIVVLMVREGRADDLFQIFDRELLRALAAVLQLKGLLTPATGFDPLAGELKVTDKTRLYLDALQTVPLPRMELVMGQITGE